MNYVMNGTKACIHANPAVQREIAAMMEHVLRARQHKFLQVMTSRQMKPNTRNSRKQTLSKKLRNTCKNTHLDLNKEGQHPSQRLGQ
jgi:hypothetical protein